MSSRFYRSYKFYYDNDLGQTVIKRHRSYLDESGSFEETPTTTLFLNRVVNLDPKVTGTSQGLRHVLSYVGTRKLIALVPYAPADSRLVDHVREILAQPQVICGDYRGEKVIKGGTTVSF